MNTTANTITAFEAHALAIETDTLTKRLFERRITPEVIATFQIEPRGNGWQYPTPGGGLRFKNVDSNAEYKYLWLDGKSEPASALYYAEDLRDQVAISGGVCWYVSGEPDVWAMRSAGIPYAFSGFTEKTISPQFADFLQSMGVMRLYIAPDLDKTGAAWAGKVAAALEGTGIELDCRRLPEELGEHGDIGKAWQRYTSKLPFVYYLLGLPRWYPEPEKPQVHTPLVVSVGEWGDVPADYRKRIMDACGVTKIRGAGFSNKVLCPFHKEDVPSADFHEQKGLFCFHEMRWYKWVEVGAVLGIEPFKQEKKPLVVSAPSRLAVEAQRKLIRLKLNALCRLLTELYQQGYTGGETLTVKELQAACPNLSAWTVREAVKQAERDFLRDFFPSSATHRERKKTLKNSRGRPVKQFCVPALSKVYAVLDVQPETWQDIPDGSLRNAAQFSAEVTAARIRHKPGKYTVKQLTKPLGISAPTLRAYCKRANIEITPTFDISEPLTADDIRALPRDKQELAEWKREGRFYRWQSWLELVEDEHKPYKQRRKFLPTQEGAARALEGGRAVRLVKRLANHYKASEKPLDVTPASVSQSHGKVTKTDHAPSVQPPVTKPTAQPSKAEELRTADFEKIVTAYRERMGEPPTKTVKEVLREWQQQEYSLIEAWNSELEPGEEARVFDSENVFTGVVLLFAYYKIAGGTLNGEAVRFIWSEDQKQDGWIIRETLREMLERKTNGGEIRKPFAYMRKVVNEKRKAWNEELEDEDFEDEED